VECKTLWGKPEPVHVQLHAHDRYQNVTEHKTQYSVYETTSTDMYNTESGSG